MSYISGFVTAVPKEKREAFLEHARTCGAFIKQNGALEVVECWGDDVPDGEVTSFPMAVKCEPDEVVVLSWIRWTSKEASEKGMRALMAAPHLQPEVLPMPFDGKRMIYGGFEVISEIR